VRDKGEKVVLYQGGVWGGGGGGGWGGWGGGGGGGGGVGEGGVVEHLLVRKTVPEPWRKHEGGGG